MRIRIKIKQGQTHYHVFGYFLVKVCKQHINHSQKNGNGLIKIEIVQVNHLHHGYLYNAQLSAQFVSLEEDRLQNGK